MTEAIETSETIPAPKPAAKPKKKRASAATGAKRKAAKKPAKKPAKRAKVRATRAGEHGKMAKAGDYAMVVRVPQALHKKMWAWAKKQDDSLSGLVRKAIERLLK